MLQTESRTIGSTTYHVRQLGAGDARRLLVRLTKAVGPVLGAVLEEAAGSSNVPVPKDAKGLAALSGFAVSRKGISRALQELSVRLTESDLEFAVKLLGGTTEIETDAGKQVPLTLERQELHFAGRMGEMFRWLAFALEVNYRDFFPVAGTGESSDLPGVE